MTEQTQNQPTELVPGTPEYDAAMIAKSEASATAPAPEAAPTDTPVKPEAVPDKFWNAEKGEVDYAAWAKSTAELEARFTKEGQEKKPEGLQMETPEEGQQDEAAKALAAVDLKIEDFYTEYAEKGELSAESYEKLAAKGFDKDLVDSHIAGQIALQERYDAKGYEAAGGVEQFSAMAEWAKANMDRAELVAFNDAVNSRDEAKMLMAVRGMRAAYEASVGKNPNLVGGGGEATVAKFRSRAELTEAMKDPRYESDSAYRADVMRKLDATDMSALYQ